MPDARVQAAIDHWAPRFVQAGVDYSDFVATTAGVERWEDWHAAWCRNGDMHAALAEEAAGEGRRLTAGEAWARATVAYHFAKFVWMVDPERSRAAADKAVRRWRRRTSTSTRTRSASRCRWTAAAWGNLRRPAGEERPPLVLLVPGLDSTKEEFFRLENVFLDRGMATLSMDGPGQGESGYDLPIRPGLRRGRDGGARRTRRPHDVDLDRVGLLGVSMGGYYAPRVLAFEPRVKAGVGPERAVQVQRHLG